MLCLRVKYNQCTVNAVKSPSDTAFRRRWAVRASAADRHVAVWWDSRAVSAGRCTWLAPTRRHSTYHRWRQSRAEVHWSGLTHSCSRTSLGSSASLPSPAAQCKTGAWMSSQYITKWTAALQNNTSKVVDTKNPIRWCRDTKVVRTTATKLCWTAVLL